VTPTDSELISLAVSSDDVGAFGELVRRHQSAVRRFLRHLARGNDSLADDLAQETFLQAHRGLSRFRGDAPFLTWILGIAHNHYRNACRRRRDEVPLEADEARMVYAPSLERRTDLRQDLSAAMDRLTPDEQLAVRLAFENGLSHSEIAALLQWPLGTVKTHLARGKDKLRELMSAWNPQI
jgi:RNA polymerase sigma-70 factor (ECF subfamily)